MGVVGFVGLVAPHVVRGLVGGRHARGRLLGVLLISLANTIGWTMIALVQIHAGLLTALMSASYIEVARIGDSERARAGCVPDRPKPIHARMNTAIKMRSRDRPDDTSATTAWAGRCEFRPRKWGRWCTPRLPTPRRRFVLNQQLNQQLER